VDYKSLEKLMEVQYLKGRLDELYKGYVPNDNSTKNRFVDYRISKYEEKLRNVDEVIFHLYRIEQINVQHSKRKSKQNMSNLLFDAVSILKGIHSENPTVEVMDLLNRMEEQLNKY
jgi:hypothetical protein